MWHSKSILRLGPLVLLGSLPFLAGCAAQTPIEAPPLSAEPLPGPVAPEEYRLEVTDLLSIRFYGNPELDDEQPVRPDGMISLPFIGQLKAAGLTPAELEDKLEELYQGELASPQVSVIVRQFVDRVVYVGGEVGQQGVLQLRGSLSLLQAIQQAEGFLRTARRKQVLVVRRYPDGTHAARSIDMRPSLQGSDQSADILLQHGDVVFVPRTKITNVNIWVEQYVRGLLPQLPVAFTL
jgi:protein involved in polysaccharide export with SLBB domain